MYSQCTLRKENSEQLSWIPNEFAKVGNILRLLNDDGWMVIRVGQEMSDGEVQAKMTQITDGVVPSVRKI